MKLNKMIKIQAHNIVIILPTLANVFTRKKLEENADMSTGWHQCVRVEQPVAGLDACSHILTWVGEPRLF